MTEMNPDELFTFGRQNEKETHIQTHTKITFQALLRELLLVEMVLFAIDVAQIIRGFIYMMRFCLHSKHIPRQKRNNTKKYV